jgi:hypothetical protein
MDSEVGWEWLKANCSVPRGDDCRDPAAAIPAAAEATAPHCRGARAANRAPVI